MIIIQNTSIFVLSSASASDSGKSWSSWHRSRSCRCVHLVPQLLFCISLSILNVFNYRHQMHSRKPVLASDPVTNLRLHIALNPQQSSCSFAESEICLKNQEMTRPSCNFSATYKHMLFFL